MPKRIAPIKKLKKTRSLTEVIKKIYSNIAFEKKNFENLYPQEFKQKFFFYYRAFDSFSALRLRFYKKRLQQALDLAKGKRVLIVGSGLGTEAFLFRAQGAVEVTGIDIDPIFISLANQRSKEWRAKNVEFIEESVFTYQPTKAFDLVFIMETFHHIIEEQRGSFFPTVSKFLTPNGIVVVSEPNGSNPLILAKLKSHDCMTGVKKTLGRYQMTDEMVVPLSTIKKLMDQSNFKIVESSRYRVIPGTPWPTLDRILAFFEPVLEMLLPLSIIGIGYTIVGKKN